MDILGSLIGAGTSLLGGLMGKSSQDKANEIAQQNAANNIALQREFAQNAIQWKVKDAEAAGIHPLYALGASTTSFSPVSVGVSGANPLAASLQDMGQNVFRAASANRAPTERLAAVAATQQTMSNNLSLENQKLQNEILKFRLQQMQSSQIGPGGPEEEANLLIPGQKNSAGINPEPMKTAPAGSNPSAEAGSITDVGYARTSTGWAPVPSKDVKERIEDNELQELQHFYRNNILPTFGYNQVPPAVRPPPGQAWIYDFVRQEYRLKPIIQSPYGYGPRPAGWYIR